MVLPGLKVWRWILFACIHWLCVCQETPRPCTDVPVAGCVLCRVYMVAVPAVIQAGSEAKLCASLLQPNETLVMTVSLMADGQNKRLLHQSSDQEFHRCVQFQAPRVKSDKVQNFMVEVRGETFLSTEERRVMIKPYSPMTFIQTDKPIYKPGQTGNVRAGTPLVWLLRNGPMFCNGLLRGDVNHNRIGQWVNTTSSGNILQLSHPLNSEAPVGSYTIVVWIGGEKIYHNFKVEQYVLPKFEIKMNLTDKISVVQEEYEVKVCAEYTYGQPVPGKAGVKLCRPLVDNAFGLLCVGKSFLTVAALQFTFCFLSYVIGEFTFVDTPQIYEHGSIIEGKEIPFDLNGCPWLDKALALYSTRVFSRGGASTVTVRSPSGDRCLFHVNQNNKLLYQERALQDTEGKYSVEVQGSACASVQVVLRYNVPTPTRSTTLSIQVTPELSIIFLRYHGKELTTNMIIVDLKMLSGFSPYPDSLGRVSLDRVDIKDDHVLMYLTELTSLPFHITLDIIQEFPVQNLKPAVVKIYDYYQPSKLLY
uniref:Alpha-macroglobulin receptor-binding domain-containing protein n=1 Tax=Oncorhynchus mykiss TaxID=8022 RepID=A0A8C7TKQ7_ONCMY